MVMLTGSRGTKPIGDIGNQPLPIKAPSPAPMKLFMSIFGIASSRDFLLQVYAILDLGLAQALWSNSVRVPVAFHLNVLL